MEHLGPLDEWFLDVENGIDHMHIGCVAVLEGPMPSLEQIREAVAAKLQFVPRYRQRLERVPGSLSRPVWVDDDAFDIDDHVLAAALPSPGGDAELRGCVGELMSCELDRTRPLWETWLVEGLPDGRWAAVTKVHHALVDGVGGMEIMATLFDLHPDAAPPAADAWRPADHPGRAGLLADALEESVARPLLGLRQAAGALRHPVHALGHGAVALRGLLKMAHVLRPMPRTSLNGPIGCRRVWTATAVDLPVIKQIRHLTGTTVNDVCLAGVTRGFREVLVARGEPIADNRVVRTMVPVNLRDEGERGRHENVVSTMFTDLPVGWSDQVAVLDAIHDDLGRHKAAHEAEAGGDMVTLGGYLTPALFEVGLRTATGLIHRFGQRQITTVATNVPGPQVPLYAAGRRVEAMYPYVPVAEGIRFGVAILSYDGVVTFGVTGDERYAPEVGVLAAGIGAGLRDLAEEVGVPPPELPGALTEPRRGDPQPAAATVPSDPVGPRDRHGMALS